MGDMTPTERKMFWVGLGNVGAYLLLRVLYGEEAGVELLIRFYGSVVLAGLTMYSLLALPTAIGLAGRWVLGLMKPPPSDERTPS